MKKAIMLLTVMFMAVPLTYAQEDMTDNWETCQNSLPSIRAELQELLDDVEDARDLDFIDIHLNSILSYCEGLSFSGTGNKVESIYLPEGVYKVVVTSETDLSISAVVTQDYCLFGESLTYNHTTQEGLTMSEGLFVSEECEVILFVVNPETTDWTLELQLLSRNTPQTILEPLLAEWGVFSFFRGDWSVAAYYICADDLVNMEVERVPEEVSIQTSCEADGNTRMICTLSFTPESAETLTAEKTFELEIIDGKLCGLSGTPTE